MSNICRTMFCSMLTTNIIDDHDEYNTRREGLPKTGGLGLLTVDGTPCVVYLMPADDASFELCHKYGMSLNRVYKAADGTLHVSRDSRWVLDGAAFRALYQDSAWRTKIVIDPDYCTSADVRILQSEDDLTQALAATPAILAPQRGFGT